jgi:PAS domain S-box-containing protein
MDLIRKTLSGDRWETVEIEIMHRDGSIRTVLWNSATLFAPDGKSPIATIAQGQDITERKKAEEDQYKSEEQYRLLFENSIDSVAVHQIVQDEKGRPVDYIFLRANAAFEKQTGLDVRAIAGKRVTEILPWIEKTPLIEIYGKVALTGQAVSFEQFFEPLSRHFHINAYQVGLGRFVTVFQDVTERKLTEQALLKSEERYRSLLTSLEAGVVVHAPDTSIIMNNQKASELLGLSEDQMRGRLAMDPSWKFLSENKVPLPLEEYPVNRVIGTKKPLNDLILGVIRPPANDLLWLNVNGFPVFDKQGEIAEILISFIDITHRKQAEDALRLKNLVFDASLAANSISDTEGIITEVNAAFLRIWGYSDREEVIGKVIPHFLADPGDPLGNIETMNEKEEWEGEYVARKKDGSTFTAHGLATTIRDLNGMLIGYQSAVIDITERKQAEEVVKESERAKSELLARLNEAQHIALIGSWEWDLQSNHVWWSDETYRIFGVGREFVPGFEANIRFIHPDDLDSYRKSFEHSLLTGEPLNIDIRIISGDHVMKYCHAEGQVFTDESGSPVRFTGTMMDVSSQKKKENEIRESEKKFRDTVAYLDEGYYSVTPEGTLLEHNQAFCRMLGFDSADDLRGSHLPDFWQNPDDRTLYLQTFATTGSISNYEITARTKQGDKITVLASAHMVKDEKGQPARIEGVFLDITARIRTEESLRRLALRLQNLNQIDKAILKAIESPEAIVQSALLLIRGQLECQRASVGIFDLEKKEVQIFAVDVDVNTVVQAREVLTEETFGNIGILLQNKMEIIEDMSRVSSPSDIIRILEAEGIESSVNVALFSSKGLYGALNIGWEKARTFTPEELEIIEEVAGQISIAIEQARLLNEVKGYAAELEKRVLERTAQLEISNKELEAFSYSVSHDLRAPLRHISGFVDLLTKSIHGALPEKEQHYLQTISDSALQMGVLIDDLLEFSRTGRQEMRFTFINMHLVLKEALNAIKQDPASQGVIWETDSLPHVYGDYALLRLVWLNLLGNAVKFRRSGVAHCIQIGFREEGAEFVFFVRDNGVGFDMQYAQKLFGVFQRLHSSQEFEGTGIGLANVKRIILRHGGRTWAEAGLGQGAVFYFSIPNIKKEEKP